MPLTKPGAFQLLVSLDGSTSLVTPSTIKAFTTQAALVGGIPSAEITANYLINSHQFTLSVAVVTIVCESVVVTLTDTS